MKDLRDYLAEVKHAYPTEVVEVPGPISQVYESTAYWHEFRNRGEPILYFKEVVGSGMPMVCNIFGSRDRIARMLGADGETIYQAWSQLSRRSVEPGFVTNGPVKEVKLIGDAADARSLPIPKYFEQDAGRYVTSGIFVSNDPGRGTVNLSFARMQLKSERCFGVSLHSRGHLWNHHQQAARSGAPSLPVAVVIGCHPLVYLAAATRTDDEYKLAGALAGERVELVRCETSDLFVPANAEIVLEGRILTGKTEDEGPFSEYTGYVTGRSTRNVFILDAITRRRDSIYQSVIPSNSAEHLLLGGIPKQATAFARLKGSHPQVVRADWPTWGTHFVAVVSVDKNGDDGLPLAVANALIEVDGYLKYVFIVDGDVNPSEDKDFLWALATRSQPSRSLHIIESASGNALDPSQVESGITSRVIIDATRPPHWRLKKYTVSSIPAEAADKALKGIQSAASARERQLRES